MKFKVTKNFSNGGQMLCKGTIIDLEMTPKIHTLVQTRFLIPQDHDVEVSTLNQNIAAAKETVKRSIKKADPVSVKE